MSQALRQGRCHIAEKLRVEIRSWFKLCAKRINHAGIGVRSIQNNLDNPRIELRFGKNAIDPLFLNATLDLGNPSRGKR